MKKMLKSSAVLAMPIILTMNSNASMAAEYSAADADSSDSAPITVTGYVDPQGLLPDQVAPVSISEVSVNYITKQAPTLNAYQLINHLPGANVATTDPYGLSPFSSLNLRGLGSDSIGVLMEGAPQNDIGYYTAYPSQFADTENLQTISLQQGSAPIDAPLVGATGGLLSVKLNNPAEDFGGLLTLSVGSYNQRRLFMRLDSGEIGNTGMRAFISYSNNRADNWRGAGHDTRQHIDAKLLKQWGGGNEVALNLSLNTATTSNYPAPTMADWQAVGRDFNHDKQWSAGNDNYWKLYRAPFKNLYATVPLHLKFGDKLALDSTSFIQFGYGNSPYATTLSTTGNYLGTELISGTIDIPGAVDGQALVMGNWTGDQFRVGNVTKLVGENGAHQWTIGLWYDQGRDKVMQSYSPIRANGEPIAPWGRPSSAILTPDGQILAYENQRTKPITKGFFLSDTIALTDDLRVELGFKGVHFLRRGTNYLPGPQRNVRRSSFAALPRASVHYEIDDRQQIFANLTTSFRAPNEFTLYNSYADGEIITQGRPDLKDERSFAQEIGYRYIGRNLSFSVTGFHYHFRNRLISTIVNSGGAQVNTSINAGTQNTWGLDAEVNYRPAEGVSIYASGEYLRSRIGDDMPVGDELLPTKGKHSISSPSFQFALGSNFDRGRLFGSSALKYVGRQYSTFMNDESIKPFATLDLSIGVHLAGLIDDQKMDLRLNALNITNPKILSGVYSATNNAQMVLSQSGAEIEGAAPLYHIGPGRAFVLSLARSF